MIYPLCIFALLALASAGDVLDLTDADFTSQVSAHDVTLVKFYAPWCGHCKKIAPEFEKAASILKNDDPPITLAEVDCTEGGKDTCSKHGVSGYPTLKIFRGDPGESPPEEYNGPRESDGIVKYMRSKAGPSAKDLKVVADLEKFLAHSDHSIVGFFEADDSEIAKAFKKLADSLNEDFRFGHTSNAEALAKYNYKDDVVIFQPKRLHNKFEGSEQKYDGDSTVQKMKTWVNDNVHGLAGHRTSGNSGQFKNPLVVAYYDVDYVKNTKGTNYWRNRVMKVAKKLQDDGKKVNFAVANAADFSHELTEYGLTAGDKPVIAARGAKDEKFIMKDDFSMETLEKFVKDFLDGKVKQYLKSEPVPASNDEPVKVIVAEEFEKLVNDDTKDVLIEFYAPWCGHCKSLAPKWDELAEKLADEEDIVIAKMDATANDVPSQYEVRGFPTLFFAPKGSKDSPKKYEGGREVDDFIKYLAAESTDPLKGYSRDGKKIKKKKSEL